jgi:hypothetical protein
MKKLLKVAQADFFSGTLAMLAMLSPWEILTSELANGDIVVFGDLRVAENVFIAHGTPGSNDNRPREF